MVIMIPVLLNSVHVVNCLELIVNWKLESAWLRITKFWPTPLAPRHTYPLDQSHMYLFLHEVGIRMVRG
jgi:hypothetical protein